LQAGSTKGARRQGHVMLLSRNGSSARRQGFGAPSRAWTARLPDRVDDYRAVDAVCIPLVGPEESRGRVVGPYGEEAIVAAQPPAAVWRVPLHAATGVAGQEGIRASDAQLLTLEHR